MAAIRTYGVLETAPEEIPAGCERISLVTDDKDGYACYQAEKPDGSFYLCDADGEEIRTVRSWTLQRVLADIPDDDNDAFFEAIEATSKGATE
jgi:hypothetical protein